MKLKFYQREIYSGLLGILFVLSGLSSFAQQSSLTANVKTPLTSERFEGLNVNTSGFSNKDRVTDADLTNHSDWSYLVVVLNPAKGWLEVKDNNASGGEVYPAGSVAGFVVDNSALDVVGSTTITTYLGDEEQESKSGAGLLAIDLGGQGELSITTTKPFDRIRISYTISLVGAGTKSVYYAFVQKFVANTGIDCNTNTQFANPDFPVAVTPERTGVFDGITVGGVSNPENAIDGNEETYASISVPVGLLGGYAALSVKDRLSTYPAGTFAGFDISSTSLINLGVLSSVTIETYLNGTFQEDATGSGLVASLGLLSGDNRNEVGFITTKEFDEIRLRINQGAANINLDETRVYSPIIKKYCEATVEMDCNSESNLSASEYPIYVDQQQSGILGVGLGQQIVNPQNVVDGNDGTYAVINKPIASVGTQVVFAVKKALTPFPAGTLGGFDIEQLGIADLSALGAVTVGLYNQGALVKQAANGDLVNVGTQLLTGTGRGTVGVIAPAPYDEIRLTIDYGLTNLSALTGTRVYNVVVTKFCSGDELSCNLPTQLTAPAYPVYIDGANTGIAGGVDFGSITNWNNAIDTDPDSYAAINQVVGVLSTATFTIGNAIDTYPENTYAGIAIASGTLLNATVLGYFQIQLLKDGQVVQTSTAGTLLVNVNTSLLTGTTRQVIGLVSNTEFDAVKLTITKPVDANLGETRVYGATFESLCEAPIECNQSTVFEYGTHPVIIDASRTGVLGVANVGSYVNNPDNVLTADKTDYAEIATVAGVLSEASLSVVNPLQTYPEGTFAGFILQRPAGIIDAGILSTIRIKTYLDGQLQEVRSGGTLLDLTLLINILQPSQNPRNIGFVTGKPFDEIQITVGELVSVATNFRIYGAFIDTRTSFGIGDGGVCSVTVPDFAVTNIHIPVSGDVSTNDQVPTGTTYGNPGVNQNNPTDDSPSVNEDGTFTFVTDTPGRYTFDIPYCLSNQTENCATETLVITVKDPNADDDNLNNPVANDDQATVTGDDTTPASVSIDVKANDGPGNAGGELGAPVVEDEPVNGTTSVDGNGNVIYEPNAGFYGTDEFTYKICESPSDKCETATVRVTVLPASAGNTTTAVDDYIRTLQNSNLVVDATHGILANDTDAEGDDQVATSKTETVADKGTFSLNADGSYSFVPVGNFYGPLSFTCEIKDNGDPVAADISTLHILVEQFETVPDFAVTHINVLIEGDVSTNDNTPSGTTYGSPEANSENPTGDHPEVNEDGTYTFVTGTPGRYTFNMPVCPAGVTENCPTETLVITVKDPGATGDDLNDPIVNNDQSKTQGDDTNPVAVTINIKANDGAGNAGGSLGDPAIVVDPGNGTVVIDGNGNAVYTPNSGFYGVDEFTYEVCESPAGKCGTAVVRVTVQAGDWINTTTAVDDFISVQPDEAVQVNAAEGVLANDIDAEGDNQTVTPQTTSITGKGTFELEVDGSYVFTPEEGFFGPVSFIYEVKDNGTPQAVDYGTLHILVEKSGKKPDLSPTIWIDDNNFGDEQSIDFVVNLYNVGEEQTDGSEISFRINKLTSWSITWLTDDGTVDVNGSTNVTNSNWVFEETSTFIKVTSKSAIDIANDGTSLKIGFTAKRKPMTSVNNAQNLTVNIDNGSGGDQNMNNNASSAGLTTF